MLLNSLLFIIFTILFKNILLIINNKTYLIKAYEELTNATTESQNEAGLNS